MHTSIVITRRRSSEVAKQVAAINARIRACYPNQRRTTGRGTSPQVHTHEKTAANLIG